FDKIKKKDAKIGVCGCTASHLGDEIFKRAPVVDFVLGARNVSKISKAVKESKFISVDLDNDDSEFSFADYRNSLYKTYINISIGCDKSCTYCIVPHTRGKELSIPFNIIYNEAKKAVSNGAKEIFLLGQNVNNYGKYFSSAHKKMNFSNLLEELSQIDGLERIRFTSPHPLHMDDEFLRVFSTNDKICKSMHMPLQSGSSAVLKAMKRGYDKKWYLDRALKLRELCPDVSISTDIIVAFPGESEEDFKDTMDVLEKVRFEQLFSFKYSKRPLTKAATMPNQIDEKTASSRLSTLQARHNEILDEIVKTKENTTMKVLFDELRSDGFVAGRSDNNFLVQIKASEEMLGLLKDVRIDKARRMVLYGEVL
ncbi:tRNA (N6-isopentenyl adenosine(37)-C2)-methylthiotransferase MiaB, partial [Campylobacter avium]